MVRLPRDRSLPPAAGPASARARLRSAPFPATAAPASPPRVVLPILLHAQHAIQLARTWGYGNRLPGCRTGVRATPGYSRRWSSRLSGNIRKNGLLAVDLPTLVPRRQTLLVVQPALGSLLTRRERNRHAQSNASCRWMAARTRAAGCAPALLTNPAHRPAAPEAGDDAAPALRRERLRSQVEVEQHLAERPRLDWHVPGSRHHHRQPLRRAVAEQDLRQRRRGPRHGRRRARRRRR